MSYVIAVTIGLVCWMILWALNISGLDASFIGIALILIVCLGKAVAPRVSGRND